MPTAFLPWCTPCLGCRTFSYVSKEGLFPKMTTAEKKRLAPLLGGKSNFLSKEGLWCPMVWPWPACLVTCTSLVPPISLCSDFQALWPSFHLLVTCATSHLMALFSALSKWIKFSGLFSCVPSTSLLQPPPGVSFTLGAFDSHPFQPKETLRSLRAGTGHSCSLLQVQDPTQCLASSRDSRSTWRIMEKMNKRPGWGVCS